LREPHPEKSVPDFSTLPQGEGENENAPRGFREAQEISMTKSVQHFREQFYQRPVVVTAFFDPPLEGGSKFAAQISGWGARNVPHRGRTYWRRHQWRICRSPHPEKSVPDFSTLPQGEGGKEDAPRGFREARGIWPPLEQP